MKGGKNINGGLSKSFLKMGTLDFGFNQSKWFPPPLSINLLISSNHHDRNLHLSLVSSTKDQPLGSFLLLHLLFFSRLKAEIRLSKVYVLENKDPSIHCTLQCTVLYCTVLHSNIRLWIFFLHCSVLYYTVLFVCLFILTLSIIFTI